MAQHYNLAHTPPPSAAQRARRRTERAIVRGLLFLTSLVALNLWFM